MQTCRALVYSVIIVVDRRWKHAPTCYEVPEQLLEVNSMSPEAKLLVLAVCLWLLEKHWSVGKLSLDD